MEVKQEMLEYLGGRLKRILEQIETEEFQQIEEIRVRLNKPFIIKKSGKEWFLTETGEKTREERKAYLVHKNDISQTMELLSSYSIYAFQEELRKGYLTIEGGHRIGLSGKTVVEQEKVMTMKDINGMNIRISHEIKGCSDKILPFLIEKEEVCHTLILSPPGCGKTTLLRDIIRQVSNGVPGKIEGRNVGIVDERSEIAGCFQGKAQNEIGIRSDVLDCCPKAEGMRMLIRSMAPRVIAVDEIGRIEDVHAIEEIVNTGVKLICTIHGRNLEDLKKKNDLKWILKQEVFQRFVVLEARKKAGEIVGIYNEKMELLPEWRDKR